MGSFLPESWQKVCCLKGWTIPEGLSQAWEAKKEVIVTNDGATIDFHGGRVVFAPRHFSLDELQEVTDPFIVSLLTDRVTAINVMGCVNLSDESIKAVALCCPGLNSLCVEDCHNLTDVSIKSNAERCSELETLDVGCCENLTDDSIKAIASGCRELNALDVCTCSQLTDESIKAVADRCPQIKELKVADCSQLTDESLKAIAKGCPALAMLNVADCSHLTDQSINAIANGLRSLTALDIQGCLQLTDESIKAVCTGCPLLRRLIAQRCRLRSLPIDTGDLLPNLEEVDLRGNKLTKLPRSMVNLDRLLDLTVADNPLRSPPLEIAVRGLGAIRRYFQELEKGTTISKLLKVVLVGDSKGGKTSLRNALAGRPNPRRNNRTILLDIEKITVNDNLDINIYDCAGQDEYLASQLPYLTGVALYLVVFEAEYAADEHSDALDSKLHRFVAVLQHRVPGAIVLPIVSKSDNVKDPKRRCQWLERKIDDWLRTTRTAANCDEENFKSLQVQLPALAISVADSESIEAVRASVYDVFARIVALTERNAPLSRWVGQKIPSTYMRVLELFGAIAELGDDELALEALRNGEAHALGRTPTLSLNGTYCRKKEVKKLWQTYCSDSSLNIADDVFDLAIQLWEAQGLIFIDAGLVVLQPELNTIIVKQLVDHELKAKAESCDIDAHIRQFVLRSLQSENEDINQASNTLKRDLKTFIDDGELESLRLLEYLWRDTPLNPGDYDPVLNMLQSSNVIFRLQSECGNPVAVVPFRLRREPEHDKRDQHWPPKKHRNQREFEVNFVSKVGFPPGVAARFAADAHVLGWSLYSWETGVIVRGFGSKYIALAERRRNKLAIAVRFKAQSTSNDHETIAWNALCRAQQMLHEQCRSFPGLSYDEWLLCERCCLNREQSPGTQLFNPKEIDSLFKPGGHDFHLNVVKRRRSGSEEQILDASHVHRRKSTNRECDDHWRLEKQEKNSRGDTTIYINAPISGA